MSSKNAQTTKVRTEAGWWATRSLAIRLFLATSVATILVMGAITAIMAWQSRHAAIDTVRREMQTALQGVDQSLQLVFANASERSKALIPVIVREFGGVPSLDGDTLTMGDGIEVPIMVVDGNIINGDIDTLQRIKNNTGANSAVTVKAGDKWVRVATLLSDASGNVLVGGAVDSADLLATALDAGQAYNGVVQHDDRWHAVSIEPLIDESGVVYGGLSVLLDVHDEVDKLLQWITQVDVAEHGSLAILRRSADANGWIPLASQGDGAGSSLTDSDVIALNALYRQPSGFAQVSLGESAAPHFLSWQTLDNWDWLMYGVGQREDFLQTSRQSLIMLLVMMLVGTLLISLLIGWLAMITLRPVRQVVAGMAELGRGDLTGRFPDTPAGSKNEVHILLDSLKHTQSGLGRTITTVRSGVDEINAGSREIAAGNADLSVRTEQQAASLQETAASMEQMAAAVRQNTDHARQANELALDASTAAERGEVAVSGVVQTMQGISTSSSRIAEIVGVIDSIAFQTNILALNAAVEAARAGEQGKGFAVVATEVRSLAQRSAEAAKEIKTLIDQSLAQVSAGSQEVAGAGATMQELLASVKRVAAIMKEIADASVEQSSGIGEVNQAVFQMDQVTQQNAALVEEASAAAAALQEQTSRLADAVAVFKTQTDQTNSVDAPDKRITLIES